MKRNFILALILVMAVFIGATCAEAAISITIKNNRSYSISFAFCWAGFDTPDDVSKGWYNVKAGETRTITFKEAVYALTFKGFGYYAKGTPKGEKTIYWSGKAGGDDREYVIHQTESFTGSRIDDDGRPYKPLKGGQKVFFRTIKLTETSREDGKATLTFNP